MSASKKQIHQDLVLIISAVLGALIFGATIFSILEGWSFIDALYFVTITATTVGYGDFVPTTALTRILTIVYSLSIVPFVLYAFTFVAKSQIQNVYKKIHHLERQQKSQEDEIGSAEKKINRQLQRIKEQQKELEEHEKRIAGQKKRLKEQEKLNKEQTQEILGHDKELEVVENIMEEALKK